MKNRSCAGLGVVAGICLFLGYGAPAHPQTDSQVSSAVQKGEVMTTRASGTFEVKLTPQAQDDKTEDANLGRMLIDKQLHGDLEGASKGQMLSAMAAVKGSAGYVAIEKVTGKLHGRAGTFVLQHTGTMNRGAQKLSITVVPDSGTGELVGLSGKMNIIIAGGKHSYEFDYSLADKP
jgi:hypothetical protein